MLTHTPLFSISSLAIHLTHPSLSAFVPQHVNANWNRYCVYSYCYHLQLAVASRQYHLFVAFGIWCEGGNSVNCSCVKKVKIRPLFTLSKLCIAVAFKQNIGTRGYKIKQKLESVKLFISYRERQKIPVCI